MSRWIQEGMERSHVILIHHDGLLYACWLVRMGCRLHLIYDGQYAATTWKSELAVLYCTTCICALAYYRNIKIYKNKKKQFS